MESIETRKQNFKQVNNLSDLSIDAANNIDLKSTYNNELFDSESQITLAKYLLETVNSNEFEYLPMNIGLDDFSIENIIADFNNRVATRNNYLSEAGPNNILVKSTESDLNNILKIFQNLLKII